MSGGGIHYEEKPKKMKGADRKLQTKEGGINKWLWMKGSGGGGEGGGL